MTWAAVSSLYGRILEARSRRYATGRAPSHRLPAPVVSVGNITMGGTGKTPFVEFLARRLRFEGRRPAILSRGFGRRGSSVLIVSEGSGPLVSPREGGDEPVELARRLPGIPIVVAARRVEAARVASDLGADLFLLDDGYQHLEVQRDVDLLLLDARDPFGQGDFPPFGRLREPLSALARADAIVFTRVAPGFPTRETLAEVSRRNPRAPISTARIRPQGLWDEAGSPLGSSALADRHFVAVCGVANPESFTAALGDLDLAAEETIVFGDHHRYRPRDVARIHTAAEKTGSVWLVTTEKDAVKLRGRVSLPLATVRLAVEVLEEEFFPYVTERIRKVEGRMREAGLE